MRKLKKKRKKTNNSQEHLSRSPPFFLVWNSLSNSLLIQVAQWHCRQLITHWHLEMQFLHKLCFGAKITKEFFSGEFFTLSPYSSVRSLPQETVLQKLLQHWILLTDCSSSQNAPGWSLPWKSFRISLLHCGSHGLTSPASKPVPVWAPLSPWLHRSF